MLTNGCYETVSRRFAQERSNVGNGMDRGASRFFAKQSYPGQRLVCDTL